MQIIAGPRGSGKTTELIKLCAKTPNSVIVCSSEQEVKYIKKRAEIMSLNIPAPITAGKLLNDDIYSRGYKYFLFDNIDFIASLFLRGGSRIIAATISDENMRFVAHGQDVAM